MKNIEYDTVSLATKKSICYFGDDDTTGERYLLKYSECEQRTHVVVEEVYQWDEVQTAVVVNELGLKNTSASGGVARRAAQAMSLIRVYAYYDNTDTLIRGSVVTAALNRAADAFILSQFGHDILYSWTVAQRNGVVGTTPRRFSTLLANPTTTVTTRSAGSTTVAAAGEATSTNSSGVAMTVIIVLIGLLTCLLFAIIVLYQYRRYQRAQQRTQKAAPASYVNNIALTSADQFNRDVANVLVDHGHGGAQWASNTPNDDASVYDQIITALQGRGLGAATPSIAPSQAYVDYTRRPDTPSYFGGSAASSVQMRNQRSITPGMPRHYRHSGMSMSSANMSIISDDTDMNTSPPAASQYADADDQGYLNLNTDDANGSRQTSVVTNADETYGDGLATNREAPRSAQQEKDSALESLLTLQALCVQQLTELDAKGDSFDGGARIVLLTTKENIDQQVAQLQEQRAVAELREQQLEPDSAVDEMDESGRASAVSLSMGLGRDTDLSGRSSAMSLRSGKAPKKVSFGAAAAAANADTLDLRRASIVTGNTSGFVSPAPHFYPGGDESFIAGTAPAYVPAPNVAPQRDLASPVHFHPEASTAFSQASVAQNMGIQDAFGHAAHYVPAEFEED